MPKVLSLVGAKGGTLKTASVAALAHLAAAGGLRVVMVDADPQADLTSRCGFDRAVDPFAEAPVAVAWSRERPLALTLHRGGRSMEGADYDAALRHLGRAARDEGADLVIVDTPPALGPLTTAAIRVSHLVLVPAVPGKESVERIHDVLRLANAQGGPRVRVALTLANRRSNLLQWMIERVDTLYPGTRLPAVVPIEMSAGEAAVYERPVTVHAARSASAAAYRALAADLLALLGFAGGGEGGPS